MQETQALARHEDLGPLDSTRRILLGRRAYPRKNRRAPRKVIQPSCIRFPRDRVLNGAMGIRVFRVASDTSSPKESPGFTGPGLFTTRIPRLDTFSQKGGSMANKPDTRIAALINSIVHDLENDSPGVKMAGAALKLSLLTLAKADDQKTLSNRLIKLARKIEDEE